MNLDSAVLYSNDIQKVVDFYEGVLELEIDYRIEDKFVRFKFSNGVGLSIKKAVEKREIPGAQTIFIASNAIEKDYKSMKKAKVRFRSELTNESWGKEFSIYDTDLNKIVFIQRL